MENSDQEEFLERGHATFLVLRMPISPDVHHVCEVPGHTGESKEGAVNMLLGTIPPRLSFLLNYPVNWLVNDAIRMEVPIPVISQAVMQLFTSRDDKKNWARAIAMMRHGFGGHPYGPDEPIVRERREGRVGDFFR